MKRYIRNIIAHPEQSSTLVCLVRMTMSSIRARMKVSTNIRRYAKNRRQASRWVVIRFDCLPLNKIISMLRPKGNICFKSVQVCAYADGIAMIAKDMSSLKIVYKMVEEEERNLNLMVNRE